MDEIVARGVAIDRGRLDAGGGVTSWTGHEAAATQHTGCLPGWCVFPPGDARAERHAAAWVPPPISARCREDDHGEPREACLHYHLIHRRRGYQDEVLAVFDQYAEAQHALAHSEDERRCEIVACAGPCDDPEGWR